MAENQQFSIERAFYALYKDAIERDPVLLA